MSHPAASFDREWRSLLAFVAIVPVLVVAANLLERAVAPGARSPAGYALDAVAMTTFVGLAVALLRVDGVSLRDLGFGRDLAVPGLAAVAAVWLVLNAVAAAAAVATGAGDALGFMYDRPVAGVAVVVVVQYGFVAVGEELAVRGFLQNKLVALLGGPGAATTRALGVVLAATTFGVLHVPDRLLTDGLAPGALVGSVLGLALVGVVFGVVYDLTRNLYLVVGLHGTGNFYPLFVDLRALPEDARLAFTIARLLAFVGVVLAYRAWGPTPGARTSRPHSEATPEPN
jgi:membrane protease YdiL (CAAX protease family)